MWDSKSAYNILPNETCAFRLGDGGQRLGLDPFGKIIDYGELCLGTGHWQRFDQVYTLLREWPRANNQG